jgi:hypothetical protein
MASDEISIDGPLSDDEMVRKDRSYSPSSDRETDARQADPDASEALVGDEIDLEAVVVLPGTGGPDDAGDIRVDTDEMNPPRGHGAH